MENRGRGQNKRREAAEVFEQVGLYFYAHSMAIFARPKTDFLRVYEPDSVSPGGAGAKHPYERHFIPFNENIWVVVAGTDSLLGDANIHYSWSAGKNSAGLDVTNNYVVQPSGLVTATQEVGTELPPLPLPLNVEELLHTIQTVCTPDVTQQKIVNALVGATH